MCHNSPTFYPSLVPVIILFDFTENNFCCCYSFVLLWEIRSSVSGLSKGIRCNTTFRPLATNACLYIGVTSVRFHYDVFPAVHFSNSYSSALWPLMCVLHARFPYRGIILLLFPFISSPKNYWLMCDIHTRSSTCIHGVHCAGLSDFSVRGAARRHFSWQVAQLRQ
jgi:hypothetical protein